MEASQGTDKVNNLLHALNITLEISGPEQEQELLQLVLKMVRELESKRTRKNPPLCKNIDQYKIQPLDNKEDVQRKQGVSMFTSVGSTRSQGIICIVVVALVVVATFF